MKKKIWAFCLFSIMAWGNLSAQSDSPLAEKVGREDSNPYRYQREKYIQEGREMLDELDRRPCLETEVLRLMDEFRKNEKEGAWKEEQLYLIARSSCDTVLPFLLNCLSNPDENLRCEIWMLIGWHRPYELIPFLLEYARKGVSSKEKIAIASVLIVMEEFQMAVKLLDQCEVDTERAYERCANGYCRAGATPSSIKFFTNYLNDDYYKLSAASFLAKLGVYDLAFPVFIEALHADGKQTRPVDRFGKDNVSRMHVVLKGLAMIGSEQAISAIESQCENKNPDIANYAANILRGLKKEGGER